MDGDVADLMADKKRAIRVRALVFRTDRTALLVENCTAAIERRVARLEERQLYPVVPDRGIDERQRLQRVGAAGHELVVQPCGNDPYGFEGIHVRLTCPKDAVAVGR